MKTKVKYDEEELEVVRGADCTLCVAMVCVARRNCVHLTLWAPHGSNTV